MIPCKFEDGFYNIAFYINACPHCGKLDMVEAYCEPYAPGVARLACGHCGYSKWIHQSDEISFKLWSDLIDRWNNEGYVHR